MDRSKTEATVADPQGDHELLTESVKILGKIDPRVGIFTQIGILRDTIECAHKWCDVSMWGVKSMTEHINDRRNALFAKHFQLIFKVPEVRAVSLLATTRVNSPNKLFWYDMEGPPQQKIRVSLHLFIDESASIIGLESKSHISGEDVLPAYEVKVLYPDDEYLAKVIAIPNGADANQSLIKDAASSLERILHWARVNAQNRVNRLGQVSSIAGLIAHRMKVSWRT